MYLFDEAKDVLLYTWFPIGNIQNDLHSPLKGKWLEWGLNLQALSSSAISLSSSFGCTV